MYTELNMHTVFRVIQARLTYQGLREYGKKRPLIISKAFFPGMGSYAAKYSDGESLATWDDLKLALRRSLQYQQGGALNFGADFCHTQALSLYDQQLCIRSAQIAVLSNPLIKYTIQKSAISEKMASYLKTVLDLRYRLQPYIYTTLYKEGVD